MTLFNLFLTFFKIGALGYGGGLAIIAMVYDEIQQFGTITAEQFANWVAITQVTPGPVGLNIATFTGYGAAGIPGSIVATLGVALPAFILVSLVCRVLFKYMKSWGVQGALTGVRPATLGLVGTALITLAKPAVISDSHLGIKLSETLTGAGNGIATALANSPVDIMAIGITLITILLILKYRKNPITVLLVMGALGAVLQA